jgi:hypothetical protein
VKKDCVVKNGYLVSMIEVGCPVAFAVAIILSKTNSRGSTEWEALFSLTPQVTITNIGFGLWSKRYEYPPATLTQQVKGASQNALPTLWSRH